MASMTATAIELHLHRQQAKALTCPAQEILFGGSVGGGKSHLMRCASIYYCQAVPQLQVYLFRRTYGELQKNHMEGPAGFRSLLAPLADAGLVSILEKEIRFHETGSKIHLCHLQHTKNIYDYQGAEIHLLLMDELTHFKENEYRYLRGRVRLGGLEVPGPLRRRIPRIINGSNPGGRGHNWVKRSFIKAGPMRLWRTPKEEGGMTRCYIPSRIADNPTLLENDPGYIDRLEGLGDPLLVRALKEGDWDIASGSMFGETWRKTRHVMDPFPIPAHWRIWMGADDGFTAPASVHWLAEDPKLKTVYVIAELYRTGMLPREFAAGIRETESEIRILKPNGEEDYLGNIDHEPIHGLMDSAAFSQTGQAEISRGNQLVNAGIRFRPAEKWPGSRIHRVQNLHRWLAPNPADPDGMPRLRFFGNCAAAIETIPSLPRDERQPEAVDSDSDDHCFDSVTYGLQWKLRRVERKRLGGI